MSRASLLAPCLALLAACAAPQKPAPSGPRPPVAQKIPHPTTWHGVTLQDDYFWLRSKDTPEVLAYLKAENAYADAVLAPLQPLREQVYAELVARVQENDESPPVKDGAYWYASRSEQGKQYATLLRRKGGPAGPDEVVLDLNALAAGKKFFSLGEVAYSDDARLVAYSVDETGYRQYELRTKDLATGAAGAEKIARVDSFAWAADGKTLLYVEEDEGAKRPWRLWRHTVGGAGKDELVYEEADEKFRLSVARSHDKQLIFVLSESQTQTEVRWLPARAPMVPLKVVEPRAPGLEYDCGHRHGELWCRTNSGGRNFKLVRAPVGTPGLAQWAEAVPHRAEVMLEGVQLFKDFAVLEEREGGLPHLRVLDLKQKDPFAASHRIPMQEPAYTVFQAANPEFDAAAFRFNYQSPITPSSWFDYAPATRTRTLVKQTQVPGFDGARYQVERLEAPAPDGVKVPVTVISAKGAARDGKGALHLSGYGAYGIPMTAAFSLGALAEVDHGVTVAFAHVRGGGDLGKRWHDDGRMLKKKNTFTDFIAVADALVAQQYAARDRLVISGGSAGGLLIGAVLNLRPDLCKAAYLSVPFVDVMNTMLDKTLPETVSEFEEWGNPVEVKAEFDYMLSYSPYDNLRDVRYPDLLVRSAYNDSQVMYWEPAKYVAKQRAVRSDPGEVLLQMNLEPAGHGGASGRYDQLRVRAFELAWVLRETGLAK
jgi:oligopeptidase B